MILPKWHFLKVNEPSKDLTMDKLKQNSDTADFDLYTYNACHSLPLTHVRKNFNTYYSLKGIYLPNTTGGRATDMSFEAGFC